MSGQGGTFRGTRDGREDDGALGRRLSGWKEIAAFFGKEERTMKRWEAHRGLPVHRLPGVGRATVYAFAGELEQWLKSAQHDAADSPEPAGIVEDQPLPSSVEGLPKRPRKRYLAGLGAVGMALALGLYWSFAGPFTAVETTHSPEAVELYLKGSYFWNKRTPAELDLAVRYFNQAIAKDPTYAEAYMGLANCYNLLREYTTMPAEEAYPKAKAAAERAIALDDGLADAHTALAFVEFYWSRDMHRAEREFRRALELDPSSVRAHHWYGTALLHLGKFDEALAEISKAQQLDPRSRAILADKGLILYYSGRVQEAVDLLRQLADSEPDYLSPRAYLSAIYFAEKNYESYVKEEIRAARLLGDKNRASVAESAGDALRSSGPEAMLVAILKEQERVYSAGGGSAYALARTYALLGDQSRALTYLKDANGRRDQGMLGMRIDPALASLRSNADFQHLLNDVGLPPYG